MDPTQLYETVVVNRDPQAPPADVYAMRFVTIPARSLPSGEVPPAELLADDLGLDGVARAEAWSLPFVLDSILGRFPAEFPWVLEFPGGGRRRRGDTPSTFAQHLAYEPVIPFESSPLQGRSLGELLAAGGASAGAAYGVVEGQAILVLAMPAGIIVIGAARGVAEALQIGIRTKMLAWMGVPDPTQPPPSDKDNE